MEYVVRVDGRVFEISKSESRKDEIVKILQETFPESEVTVDVRKGGRR